MAFNAASGAGGFGAQAPPSTSAQTQDGPELQEIQTDQLGFSSISGDAKVQLLPSAWPIDSLPSPTSSLLSIASSKGYLAAAGPNSLVLASTESVRKAFSAEGASGENIKPFQAPVNISVPRLSQVAFSADENVLVVSPQESGSLIVYHVDGMISGRTEPALQISTNNTGLRVMMPNPVTESAELFALVTTNGELLMADLKTGQLISGANGPILMTGVSCLSWSNKGKQLVAGRADGTAVQMKPDGTVVAQIPKSASIPENTHLAALSWLENDSFFAVYTSNDTTSDGMMPQSDYFIISRTPKTNNSTFQRLPEVCPPFGLERLPSFHFITRLRYFPPHLKDLLIIASTTSIDISLLSNADAPLSKEEPITDAFTLTLINDDTRKASLPLSKSGDDTSPIGVGLDLSSKDVIGNPIPSDPEIQQSSTPVPNFMVLTHEGVLASWWIVYSDSIREKTTFSGFALSESSRQTQLQTPSTPLQPSATEPVSTGLTSAFGQSGFGVSSLRNPAANSFAPASASSGPASSPAPAFGTKSTIGSGTSSWTSTGFGSNATPQPASSGLGKTGFGAPAFGSATPVGAAATPAFGAASSLANRQPAFGQTSASSTPAFGQLGFGAKTGGAFGSVSTQSPLANASGAQSTSGFAAFSNTNGFGGFSSAKKDGASVFGQAASNSFSNSETPSAFGSKSGTQSPFGQANQGKSVFGASNGGFKIQSTFQGDGSAKDDLPKPPNSGGFGLGGQKLEDLLGSTPRTAISPTHDNETDMDEKEDDERNDSHDEMEQSNPDIAPTLGQMVTPPSTIIQHKTTPAPPLSNLFGISSQRQTTPVTSQTTNAGWSFGGLPSTTPKDTPGPSHLSMFRSTTESGTKPAAPQKTELNNIFGVKSSAPTPKAFSFGESATPTEDREKTPQIKAEPPSDDESTNLQDVPEAPLPPEPTSKASYSPGDTSVASNNSAEPEDAPLPPDFIPANKSAANDEHEPELPDDDDDFSSDFEGSGEDVASVVSPSEEHPEDQTEQLLTSPESSFGRSGEKSGDDSPTGGVFTKVTSTQAQKPIPRPLFGEIGSSPMFPPPKPHESPRSPSPIRNMITSDFLRPEAPRSFSAPARPPILQQRKGEMAKSAMAQQTAREQEEKIARDQARVEMQARMKAQAEADIAQALEDDEDERLRIELEEPVDPSPSLDAFLPHQPTVSGDISKSGIPGQIERLYQDINSMTITIGINARSLSAFMMYQQNVNRDQTLVEILQSNAPIDAINQEWLLGDTRNLPECESALNQSLEATQLSNVNSKLQQCQSLLGKDISDLRSKLMAMRKSLNVRSDPTLTVTAPLSPEQAVTQQELRKSSTAIQTRVVQAEESLSVLRAKLAEAAPSHDKISGVAGRGVGRNGSQKKPTVEAVMNTIVKMTSMAEKKSADIDLLEAQMKRLNVDFGESRNGSRQASVEPSGTPQKARTPAFARSTGSAPNSVYHTPDSKFSASARSTPGTGRKGMRTSMNGSSALVSVEEREKWQLKAQRKREIATILRDALAQRRSKAKQSQQVA